VIRSASVQLKRVLEIVDALPDIKESPKARTLPNVKGSVEFRNVSFHYLEERPVLKDINLKVRPGEVVALVARTGSGKTTMASLLLRFYDPTSGAILLDGHDLRQLRTDWLRRQVSIVLQEPILFAATVAENIGYGRPGASRSEIETAARLAQAEEFIRELPNGYETVLGERGVNFSGGQRQRLSIARAFLKNAPILVLDEPTSALDANTEQALLANMRELMRGRTTFIIAHRLSTVRSANLIAVLENGMIIEQGSHAELLAGDTAYKKMCHAQFGDDLKQASTLVAAG
jgi:ABC-type multidrug transport system fused ATPase/permease subunit